MLFKTATLITTTVFGCIISLTAGCSPNAPPQSQPASDNEPVAPSPVATAIDGSPEISIATLRKRLGANDQAQFEKAGGKVIAANLMNAGVEDITPLAGLPLKYLDLTNLSSISDLTPLEGMPLEQLYLEGTSVADLTPLAGMPLQILRLEHTKVQDLTPLTGMRLTQLNLFDTLVTDISVVASMPLNTLWITNTKVTDLGPVKTIALESLDVENSLVSDLTALAGKTSLTRLNIAGAQVTDLTPLAGLQLQRLIFTPDNITEGLDVVRNMPSIEKIGPSFDEVTDPQLFWAGQANP